MKKFAIFLIVFFEGIFNLSLTKMVTPILIKVTYGLFLIVGGLSTVILFFLKIGSNPTGAFFVILIYFLSLIILRTWAEFIIIAFKIEKNTRQKEDKISSSDENSDFERLTNIL